MPGLRFPAPYFGGKRLAAPVVWDAIGRDVRHYIEPFCGTAAVLLAEPVRPERTETINDADGYVVNALRALRSCPEEVAAWADWPVSETDLVARHLWLVNEGRPDVARLMADPEWCDPKAAGWWLWGASCWIGAGWCTGRGKWTRAAILGEPEDGSDGGGVRRKLPHMSHRGQGVTRQLPILAKAAHGVHRQLPHLVRAQGVHSGGDGPDRRSWLAAWFGELARRLERVRIVCGDWSRVVTPSVLFGAGEPVGVFLDPPYRKDSGRDAQVYRLDSDVFADVANWAFAHGDDPRLRIVLAGWDGDVALPPGWRVATWRRPTGYANRPGRQTHHRERLWLSPHCAGGGLPLFAEED